MARVPLAWRQLTHEKARLAAALAGISFAVILMLLQLGLAAALFDAAVLLYSHFGADLILVSPQFEYVVQTKSFPRERLHQARGVDGVDAVTPVFVSMGTWKDPVAHEESSLLVIGFDPRSGAFDLPGLEGSLRELELPDVVLFDAASHRTFGPVAQLFRETPRLFTEINNRRVRIGGTFRLGAGFAARGNVFTSDLNFLRLFPNRSQHMVDIGLIRLAPGADVAQVRAQIDAALPEDVNVFTRDEFMKAEQSFWDEVSPIGFIFGMGVLMGFVVGSVIVYQILYTDVSDHLAEYATLKALGYGDRYLFSIVFKEALLLAVLGYIPGLLITQGLYVLSARNTGLPIAMSMQRVVTVFLFTILMCCASAALAMRRIRSADPAEIF
jgi:putative ABC transport system permease protein